MSLPSLSTGYRRTAQPNLHDRYLLFLAFVLTGYALLGRGFAYAGLPPLYVGEMALAGGLAALLHSRCALAALSNLPAVAILALMAWVTIRTLPHLPAYGIDAVRDSVVAFYGLFAFVVVALLIERPGRLAAMFAQYRVFASLYPAAILALIAVRWALGDHMPSLPSTGVPLIGVRGGEIGFHLAGAVVFVLLGLGRMSLPWLLCTGACLAVIASQTRGGTLAVFGAVLVAAILAPTGRRLSKLSGTLALLLALAVVTNVTLRNDDYEREISARQVVMNVLSTVSSAPPRQDALQDNKEWRLQWWEKIVGDTVGGSLFWSGRGFGPNIAVEDGVEMVDPEGGKPLRSPHNIMMTMLARGGVPGLALWLLACGTWVAAMVSGMRRARARREEAWARVFVFLLCYWLAAILDALFDVALEGPMVGIWFWVLHGTGIAALLIHDHEAADAGRTPAPEGG